MMNYEEAVEYLYGIPRFVGKTTAENTLKMLELLGNPQKTLKIFHVAGSNGKGSVCAFLCGILTRAGIHTGMFTSPHLVKPNERIRVDNIPVCDEDFVWAFTRIYDMVTENGTEGIVHPSFFEFIFLMCLVLFEKHKVEYAIMEVGLGGRLDATNVLSGQLVSVITSISLEHTEILGDTTESIAGEKAGIIKNGVSVVYDASEKSAALVIEETASEKGAESYPVSPENIHIIKKTDKYIDFSFKSVYDDNIILRTNIPAEYQTINASLAYMAMKLAVNRDAGLEGITEEQIREGIRETFWEGRMERIELPTGVAYLDGAHNVSGIESFLHDIENIGNDREKSLLFGVVRDKDYKKMIGLIAEGISWKHVYIVSPDTSRAADAEEIEELFRENGIQAEVRSGLPEETFAWAVSRMDEREILFCTGSLYLVGDIKRYINRIGVGMED